MYQSNFKALLTVLLLAFGSSAFAQYVQGVEAKIVGDDLVVTYKVAGINSSQLFDIELFSSADKFATGLKNPNITGKIGARIPLEASNDIVIKNPLDVIQGVTNISFKVRVKMVFNPVTVTNPITPYKQKIKKDFVVTWYGGLVGEVVSFDLYRNGELVKDNFHTSSNTGSIEIKFPKVAKGDNYQVMMELPSLSAPVELPIMRVRPKKSVAARVITWGVLLGGGFAAYNSLGGGGVENNNLPDAPEPPGAGN